MERMQKYLNPTERELSYLTDGLQIRGWSRVARGHQHLTEQHIFVSSGF